MNSNKLEYVPGTWVFLNKPDHQYHGMIFQVSKILPMVGLNAPKPHKGFLLTYGRRSIEVSHSEMIKKGTPEAKPFETGSYQLNNAPNFMAQAEAAAKMATPGPEEVVVHVNKHEGCEVVTNYADGKPFKYCRDCKEEVLDGTSEDKKA